ncbi:TlpA family protein disulfide reductase [Echinicola shivajiensis]|uniref:TlpA family protein disulfide reductase n=1 Tax=Echinicola shivajiensis TaxID=1035916 RepID=UPI001BFC79AD|nr:thioredoxin family protein [Echinicola shivajiensis]
MRFRIDRLTGQAFFGGPSAPYFELQQMVRNTLDQAAFNTPPLMVTGNLERTMETSPMDSLYSKALSRISPLHLVMDFVERGNNDLDHARTLLEAPIYQHPVWDIIKLFEEKIDREFLEIIRAETMGKLLEKPIRFLSEVYREAPQSFGLYEDLLIPIMDSIPFPYSIQAKAPSMVKAQLGWLRIKSKAEGTSFLTLLDQCPAPLRDQLYAYYFFENTSLMEDPAPILRRGLQVVETPWIRDIFKEILAVKAQGSPMLPVPLLSASGNTVKLEKYRNKTVFLYFWLSGCKFCMDFYQQGLSEAMAHFKDDPDVVFVTVNGDLSPNRWLKAVESGNFCDPQGHNYYALRPSPLFDDYHISSYPYKMVLSPGYRIYKPALSDNDAESIIQQIDAAKAVFPSSTLSE